MNGCHVSSCLQVDGPISGSLRYHHSESLGSIWFPPVSLCMILKKEQAVFMRIRFADETAILFHC